jgi:peroxiredoxin
MKSRFLRLFPHVPLATVSLVVVLAGCKPSPPPSASAKPAAPAPEPAEPPPVVKIDGLNLGPVSDADRAWDDLEKSLEAPPTPAEWETHEPTPAEVAAYEKKLGALAAETAGKARVFQEKFPAHPKAPEARSHELELLGVAVQLGQTNLTTRLEELEKADLARADLSPVERLEIRIKQLQRQVKLTDDRDPATAVTTMEKGVRSLMTEFPSRPEPLALLLSVAEGWLGAGEPEKARPVLKELQQTTLPEELREAIQGLESRLNRVGNPVDLKVTTLDGKTLELTSLRGKVVLVQFWATWSAASMKDLTTLKQVYDKLHPKGFEVVGISLDRERSALEQVVADQQIPWAQSFEGETGTLAEQFAIASIPTLWLVDRAGNLRELNVRGGLEARVTRLLGEAAVQ